MVSVIGIELPLSLSCAQKKAAYKPLFLPVNQGNHINFLYSFIISIRSQFMFDFRRQLKLAISIILRFHSHREPFAAVYIWLLIGMGLHGNLFPPDYCNPFRSGAGDSLLICTVYRILSPSCAVVNKFILK